MEKHFVQLISIVLFAGGLSFLEKIIVRRIRNKMKITLNVWSKTVLSAIRKPFYFFIWFTALAYAIRIFQQMFIQDDLIKSLSFSLYKLGVLSIFMWTIFRFINKFERLSSLIKKNEHNAIRIAQFLRVLAFGIGGICFLQLLEIPLSGLLAFGGVGGIALGFAAKDLFANFFGGFMIFLDKPFQIGDWIRSPNQEIEGRVEHIGWRLTRIRTPNKSLIFVPNTIFSTIVVDNFSQMSNRQIKTKITLDYIEPEKALELILEVQKHLGAHSKIDATLPFFANLISCTPLGLEIIIQAYTKTVDLIEYQFIQQEVLLKVLTITESHGARLARVANLIPFG